MKRLYRSSALSFFKVRMEEYYRRQAKEYEQMYYRSDPLWQKELKQVRDAIKEKLKDRNVLEIACGPGYWTRILSEVAQTTVATDAVQEMLDIAKTKKYSCPASFVQTDAYHLSFKNNSFDAGMANFWFSHIPKSKIHSFLEGFHNVLQNKSRVFMTDNAYVPGIGGQLIIKEGDENTYKLRTAGNGSKDLVLKNYYQANELTKIFSQYAKSFNDENIVCSNFFWFVVYDLR
jgi:ubiquinone/menaquinone biosynthesis C-methylase UbiE